jgi:ABC-type Fe3+ transport system permease subunit
MFKMKHFKFVVILITIMAMFSIPLAIASADSFVGDACSGLTTVTADGCTKGGDTIKSIAHNVVNIMSIVVGILSIIMLLVAGIKFVTSGGESNSVQSARNTLIYALIGVFIAVIAQVLVHLVLNTANSIQKNSYLNTSSVIEKDG